MIYKPMLIYSGKKKMENQNKEMQWLADKGYSDNEVSFTLSIGIVQYETSYKPINLIHDVLSDF